METKTYWEHRLSENFDLQGVGFQGTGYEYNEWLYKFRAYIFRKLIRKYAKKNVLVLDVGTGTGFYLKMLWAKGYRDIHALDFNNISAAILKKEFPEVTFHNCDISDPLSDELAGRFDLVICMDVLFHIVNNEAYNRAIQNLSWLTSATGTLIISENLGRRRSDRGHIVDRTEKEIYSSLKKNDISVVEEIPMFIMMNKPYKTESKFALWLSNQRIKVLRWNHKHGLGGLNYIIGMITFCVELAADALNFKGKGTSVLVCKRNPRTD